MKLLIREFIPVDGSAIADLYQAAAPAQPHWEADRYWDSPSQFQRWIAKRDGHLVGLAEFAQQPDDARQFWVSLYVHPDEQRRGIGAALYAHMLNALHPLDPALLRARVHADQAAAIRFLSVRGFRVESRVVQDDDHVHFVKLLKATGETRWNPHRPSTLTAR